MSQKYETYKKSVEKLVATHGNLSLLNAVKDIGELVDNYREKEEEPGKPESKITKDEIMAIHDPAKRVAAIRANPHLFERGE